MGLDVHDMENLGEVYVGYNGQPKSTQFGRKSLRLGRPLEPGFVLTIEPGIYFIPELIDLWRSENKFTEFLNYDKLETYKDFSGIRNEEDYLITEDGARLLGKKIPVHAEDVEAEKLNKAREKLQQGFFLKKCAVVPYDGTFFSKNRLSYPTTALFFKKIGCRRLRQHFLKKGRPVVGYDSASWKKESLS